MIQFKKVGVALNVTALSTTPGQIFNTSPNLPVKRSGILIHNYHASNNMWVRVDGPTDTVPTMTSAGVYGDYCIKPLETRMVWAEKDDKVTVVASAASTTYNAQQVLVIQRPEGVA